MNRSLLIDADALLRFVEEQAEQTKRIEISAMGVQGSGTSLMDLIRYKVANAPTIDAQRVVHAHWRHKLDGSPVTCSACGEEALTTSQPCGFSFTIETIYCHNCGAIMDETRELLGGGANHDE